MAENKLPNQRKMMKNIIIAVVVLILMVAAVMMLKYIPEDMPGEEISNTDDYVTVFSGDYDDITKISITNADGENTYIEADDKWVCENNTEIEVGSDRMLDLAMNFSTIIATLVEDQPEDLKIYGFDEPSSKVSLGFNDGSEKSFILGSLTATGSGYYFKTADEDAVYILPDYRCKSFFTTLYDLRDSNVFTPNADETYSVSVENKNGKFKIEKYSADNTESTTLFMSRWQVVSPNKLEGDDEVIQQTLFNKMELVTLDFIDDNKADYEKYGLNDPVCVVKYEDYDDNVKTLQFGKMVEGNIYLKVSDAKWLYVVSADRLDVLDAKYLDLASSLAMLEKLDNVDTIDLYFDDTNYTLKIDRTGDSEKYLLDDKAVKEETFKKLYQDIIGVPIEGEISIPGTGYHVLTVTFNYIKDLPTKTINYYTYEDRYASIIIDGELNFYTTLEKVQRIIDGVNAITK